MIAQTANSRRFLRRTDIRSCHLTLLVLASLAGVGRVARAQSTAASLSGVVRDAATGAPLAQAVVQAEGGPRAVTDGRGRFRLDRLRAGEVTLRVSERHHADSLVTRTVSAGRTEVLDMALRATRALASPADVSLATVARVDAEREADVSAPHSLADLLQGRVSSLAVNRSSGAVGETTTLRLRGVTSDLVANAPLVIVDGVRISNVASPMLHGAIGVDPLNDLDPADIERIEVLKGAAATSLYGSDGAAGVIQIFTRRGVPGQQRFEQQMRVEASTLDPAWSPRDNAGFCRAADTVASSSNPLCRLRPVGTLVRDNPLARYGVLSNGGGRRIAWFGRGGGERFGFALSSAFDDATGTLPNSRLSRGSLRGNLDLRLGAHWRVDMHAVASRSLQDGPPDVTRLAAAGSPLTRDSTVNPATASQSTRQDGWIFAGLQPDRLARVTSGVQATRTLLGVDLVHAPTARFTQRLRVAVASDAAHDAIAQPGQAFLSGPGTQVEDSFRDETRRSFEYQADIVTSPDVARDWRGAVMVGAQYLYGTAGSSYRNAFFPGGGASSATAFSERKQGALIASAQFDWHDRLSVRVSERVEKFFDVPQTDLIAFGGVQASYRVDPSRWMRAAGLGAVRLRAAWGEGARSPVTLDDFAGGVGPAAPFAPGVRPERGHEIEVGAQMSAWSDRLALDVAWYRRETRDLWLMIPQSSGPIALIENRGRMRNQGIEVTLDARLLSMPRWSWEARVTGSTLENVLIGVGGSTGAFLNMPGNSLVEGQPVGVTLGNRILSADPATGVVTVSSQLSALGHPLPGVEGGLQTHLTYAGWITLHLSLDGRGDYSIMNQPALERETFLQNDLNRLVAGALSPVERLRRYGNPDPSKPAFVDATGQTYTTGSIVEAYLQPGDFVRLREVGLTFRLSDRLADRVRASGARITVAVTNVALWTRYGGADPEVLNSPLQPVDRRDGYQLPHGRQVTLRIAVDF